MNVIFSDFLNVKVCGKYNINCVVRVLNEGTNGKFMRSGILASVSMSS